MNFQAAGDLTGAQNALDAFGPATDIQAYTQLYLQLYAGFKTNDTLTADERAELTAMTRLCPFIYGPDIVFTQFFKQIFQIY